MRRIISAIGVDVETDQVLRVAVKSPQLTMSTQKMNFSGGQGQRDMIVYTGQGRGMGAALHDIALVDEHQLFIGLTKIMVLGEGFVRQGVHPILDFVERIPVLPVTAFVVVGRPDAAEIINIDFAAKEMYDLQLRHYLLKPELPIDVPRIWQLFQMTHDPGQDPYLPIISPGSDRKTVQLIGLALFRGDRMVGEIDVSEMKFFSLLAGFRKEIELSLPLGGAVETDFHLTETHVTVKAAHQKGRPRFDFSLCTFAEINELGGRDVVAGMKDLQRIEKQTAAMVEKECLSLLKKLQSMRSDPLHLAKYYRVKHHWGLTDDEWRHLYPKAELRVKVEFHIERLGVMR